jgi:hypothetical protein
MKSCFASSLPNPFEKTFLTQNGIIDWRDSPNVPMPFIFKLGKHMLTSA